MRIKERTIVQEPINARARTALELKLAALESVGGTAAEILALFDSLPAVCVDVVRGRWHGSSLPSGHPLDRLLERIGWYGKEFNGPEDVHPLLCRDFRGRIYSLNPAFVPMGLVRRNARLCRTRAAERLFSFLGHAAATTRPTARLRMMEFRRAVTATMIYDSLPILDVFRAVGNDTLLGLMDMRGMEQPLFFVLRRDGHMGS
jgi:hypothetical protein